MGTMRQRAGLMAAMALTVGLGGATWSTEAAACGGTFCDAPTAPNQPPMPVDQSGENVLFVMHEGMVEAHIQVQYTGEAERFAWVIPVPEVPEFQVGNQELFVRLLNATVPTFRLTTTFDGCNGGQGSSFSSGDSGSGCGFSAADSDSATPMAAGGGNEGSKSTDENKQLSEKKQSVGAFQITVLDEGSPGQVSTWLEENGFLDDPQAPGILQDYSEKGHVFVAVELQAGAGLDEIHPLVIRYPGSEPCVPLKLTSIAAVEDMSVRAFFLGSQRVVPTSYKHITLNPFQLDWLNVGVNYDTVVSNAVDSPVADGRAFLTEYAGTSNVVMTSGIVDGRWDAEVLALSEPAQVMEMLDEWDLFSCDNLDCSSDHPMVIPMLRNHLPAPLGLDERTYYSCVSCYDPPEFFDAQALADEFLERIVEPAEHAVSVVRNNPYLTRLRTLISPSEMNVDPMFQEQAGLEDVSADLAATVRTTCVGDMQLSHQGGDVNNPLSSGLGQNQPWVSTVDEYGPGAPVRLVDNRATISQQVGDWNSSQSFDEGDPAPADDSTFSDGNGSRSGSNGCACSLGTRRKSSGLVLLGAAALLILRRRRRPSLKVGA